jgi:hypothetical protein
VTIDTQYESMAHETYDKEPNSRVNVAQQSFVHLFVGKSNNFDVSALASCQSLHTQLDSALTATPTNSWLRAQHGMDGEARPTDRQRGLDSQAIGAAGTCRRL